MKKIVAILTVALSVALSGARANDGVFYAQGNQLIPINETEIAVKKEILSLKRSGNFIEVNVYYEFFNPTPNTKNLLVGFEAAAPYPYEGLDNFPAQPNIHDFKVIVNGQALSYQVAHVENELFSYDKDSGTTVPKYYINGKVRNLSRKECEDLIKENDEFYFPFDYVYHFNAEFKPGLNTVKHTYKYLMSNSVDMSWYFPYVLTAAGRWANGKIGDFTLNIDMGPRESFNIFASFFKSDDEWIIDGAGLSEFGEFYAGENSARFHIKDGSISFRKKNFKPEGELSVFKPNNIWDVWDFEGTILGKNVVEATRDMYCDWSFIMGEKLDFTPEEKRIMKNLPFAKRGYVFKSKDLQDYFESTAWYVPDPSYVADMEKFPPEEKKWVEFWMK